MANNFNNQNPSDNPLYAQYQPTQYNSYRGEQDYRGGQMGQLNQSQSVNTGVTGANIGSEGLDQNQNVSPDQSKEGKSFGQGLAQSGGLITTAGSHLYANYQLNKEDPSQYFQDRYYGTEVNPGQYQEVDSPYAKDTKGRPIAENAMRGATAGSSLGPVGMIFGALGGATSGAFKTAIARKKEDEFRAEQERARRRHSQAVQDYYDERNRRMTDQAQQEAIYGF